jgi:hypothetical protein
MSTIPPASAMNTILQLMLANEVSLWDLMKTVLSTPQPNYQPIKDSLQQHAVDICCLLFLSVGCCEIVFSWAFETVVEVLCEEIVDLLSECNSLHFKVSKMMSTQLEYLFMRTLALKIKKVTPNVFKMLLTLLDANPAVVDSKLRAHDNHSVFMALDICFIDQGDCNDSEKDFTYLELCCLLHLRQSNSPRKCPAAATQ